MTEEVQTRYGTEENELIWIVNAGLHGHTKTIEEVQTHDPELLAWNKQIRFILWHVDPLLGNDREISNYTTAVAKLWPCKQRRLLGNGSVAINWSSWQTWMQQLHCNRRTVFSTRSVAVSEE
jgi:hypothetical protein